MNKRTSKSLITVADSVGVSYNHLWRVLSGKRESPSLLLTLYRLYPWVICEHRRSATLIQIIAETADHYRWSGKDKRYILKKAYCNK